MKLEPLQVSLLASRGWSQTQVAQELGVTRQAVSLHAKKHGITFQPPPHRHRAGSPSKGYEDCAGCREARRVYLAEWRARRK